MVTPAFSVVICSLGRPDAAKAVASVVESARAGSVATEVLLVWQAQDPIPPLPQETRVLRVANIGVSHARNRGATATGADVVAFVDDDECVVTGWATALVSAFREDADIAVGPILPADNIGHAHGHLSESCPRWYTDPKTAPWIIGGGGNLAIRRALLHTLGGFDHRMGAGTFGRAAEDAELIARALMHGARIRWRPDMAVLHPSRNAAERLASRAPYAFGSGRMVRRLRSPGLARRYAVGLLRGVGAAIRERSRRRVRELAASAASFCSGALTRDGWVSPSHLTNDLPPTIRGALGDRSLVAWAVPHRAAPHFLWGAGDDLVLHAYAGAQPGFTAGAAARSAALRVGLTGVPAIVAAAAADDLYWVLEQRLPGRCPSERTAWWTGAADWAVALARATGPPLRCSPWWHDAQACFPRQPRLIAALECLGDAPSAIVHGDLQRKNVLVDADGHLAVVDWEQAVAFGPRGIDLLYLAVTARAPGAWSAAVRDLLAGRDPAGTPVLSRLRDIGMDSSAVHAALTVGVNMWARDEIHRRRMLGAPPQPASFEPLVGALNDACGI